MNTSRWLLERCGVAQPVVGDIVEDAAQRSSLWRWKQVASAVGRALLSDATSHPVILIRGLTIGWFVLLPVSQTVLEWFWSAVNLRWIMFVVHIGLRHHLNPLTGLPGFCSPYRWGSLSAGSFVERLSHSGGGRHHDRAPVSTGRPKLRASRLQREGQPRFLPYAIVNGIGLTVVSASLLTGALSSRTNATP